MPRFNEVNINRQLVNRIIEFRRVEDTGIIVDVNSHINKIKSKEKKINNSFPLDTKNGRFEGENTFYCNNKKEIYRKNEKNINSKFPIVIDNESEEDVYLKKENKRILREKKINNLFKIFAN